MIAWYVTLPVHNQCTRQYFPLHPDTEGEA